MSDYPKQDFTPRFDYEAARTAYALGRRHGFGAGFLMGSFIVTTIYIAITILTSAR